MVYFKPDQTNVSEGDFLFFENEVDGCSGFFKISKIRDYAIVAKNNTLATYYPYSLAIVLTKKNEILVGSLVGKSQLEKALTFIDDFEGEKL
ncbi:MAG: hypothetical protein Q7S33_00480 [Nanoarchaeota archaeon]|nr:hypothetical protein [Nanoarchaeota archaeon]